MISKHTIKYLTLRRSNIQMAAYRATLVSSVKATVHASVVQLLHKRLVLRELGGVEATIGIKAIDE
jgi:hypothetical protein